MKFKQFACKNDELGMAEHLSFWRGVETGLANVLPAESLEPETI